MMTDQTGVKDANLAAKAAAFALWLVTAVVGLWQIGLIRDLIFRLMFRFQPVGLTRYEAFKQQRVAGALGTFIVLLLSLIWIAVVIGGAEYHRRRIGRRESWLLFSRVLAVEFGLALLPLFI